MQKALKKRLAIKTQALLKTVRKQAIKGKQRLSFSYDEAIRHLDAL